MLKKVFLITCLFLAPSSDAMQAIIENVVKIAGPKILSYAVQVGTSYLMSESEKPANIPNLMKETVNQSASIIQESEIISEATTETNFDLDSMPEETLAHEIKGFDSLFEGTNEIHSESSYTIDALENDVSYSDHATAAHSSEQAQTFQEKETIQAKEYNIPAQNVHSENHEKFYVDHETTAKNLENFERQSKNRVGPRAHQLRPGEYAAMQAHYDAIDAPYKERIERINDIVKNYGIEVWPNWYHRINGKSFQENRLSYGIEKLFEKINPEKYESRNHFSLERLLEIKANLDFLKETLHSYEAGELSIQQLEGLGQLDTLTQIEQLAKDIDKQIAEQKNLIQHNVEFWAKNFNQLSTFEQLTIEQSITADIKNDSILLAQLKQEQSKLRTELTQKNYADPHYELKMEQLHLLEKNTIPQTSYILDHNKAKLNYIKQYTEAVLTNSQTPELQQHKEALEKILNEPGIDNCFQTQAEKRLEQVNKALETGFYDKNAQIRREFFDKFDTTKLVLQTLQNSNDSEKTSQNKTAPNSASSAGGAPEPQFEPPKNDKDKEKKSGLTREDIKNKAEHCFGEKNLAKHKLIDFLKSFNGNKEAAYKALLEAANKYVKNNGLTATDTIPNPIDIPLKIKGYQVTAKIKIINKIVRVTTAFIRGTN